MNSRKLTLAVAVGTALLAGCTATTKSLTGRTQLDLVPESQINAHVENAFAYKRATARMDGKLVTSGAQYDMLVDVTNRLIEQAVRIYPQARDWKWEFIFVDNGEVNASCMHGGKMMFYSGFFKTHNVTRDEVAIIMGHEIAHALSNHSKEKMSLAIASQGVKEIGAQIMGQVTGSPQMSQVALTAASSAFLTLPNGRETEFEADHVGAELAARAGFNPAAGVALWERLDASGGNKVDFFSTHPADAKRAEALRLIDKSLQPLYQAAKKKAYSPFDWLNGNAAARPLVTDTQRVALVDAKNPPSAQEIDKQVSVRLVPQFVAAAVNKPQIQPPVPNGVEAANGKTTYKVVNKPELCGKKEDPYITRNVRKGKTSVSFESALYGSDDDWVKATISLAKFAKEYGDLKSGQLICYPDQATRDAMEAAQKKVKQAATAGSQTAMPNTSKQKGMVTR